MRRQRAARVFPAERGDFWYCRVRADRRRRCEFPDPIFAPLTLRHLRQPPRCHVRVARVEAAPKAPALRAYWRPDWESRCGKPELTADDFRD